MLEHIEKELQIGGVTPQRAADMRVQLSGYYSNLSGQLEEVLKVKPAAWLAIRGHSEVKSDKSADRHFDSTELGLKEMSLRMNLKRHEKAISALSSLIRVKEGEARNQF